MYSTRLTLQITRSTYIRSSYKYISTHRSLATVSNMPVPQGKLEITAEVGGEENVKKLLSVARDFRSEWSSHIRTARPSW
jgi:hypothetical protein